MAAEAARRKSREDVIFEVAEGCMNKLPGLFDMELAKLKFPVQYDACLNTVVVQEAGKYNLLSRVLSTTLKSMMDATQGKVVMSDDLEKLGNSLFFGAIPDKWLLTSYPSLKPLGSYIANFVERLAFIQKWLDTASPVCFWISGFYFPQAFLTGTLQNFARKYSVPIDTCAFEYLTRDESAEDITEAPEDGGLISGMFLEGARWNKERRVLDDSLPKQLYALAPVVFLKPVEKGKGSSDLSVSRALYRTAERRGVLATTGHSSNFCCYIDLASDRSEETWIMGGVALLLSLPM